MDTILSLLASINPLYAVAAFGVYAVFGPQIRSLLGRIPLPSFTPAPAAPVVPAPAPIVPAPASPSSHPLAGILLSFVRDKFASATTAGADPHDVYVALANAVKSALTPPAQK